MTCKTWYKLDKVHTRLIYKRRTNKIVLQNEESRSRSKFGLSAFMNMQNTQRSPGSEEMWEGDIPLLYFPL